MSEKSEQAQALHTSGFNCAQSVLAPFCKALGLDEELALRVAGGFGGGLRSGEVCGAVTGAVMVLGLKYGQVMAGDLATKENCAKVTMRFVDEFKARQGAILCRDLLGYDVRDVVAKARNPEKAKVVCPGAIAAAVALLEELGF